MDIRLTHQYNDDRRNNEACFWYEWWWIQWTQKANWKESHFASLVLPRGALENKRIWEIEANEKVITWLKENKEQYLENEIAKYKYTVKENNNHFCICGIRCKKEMGKTKFRCGKETCNLYEHQNKNI